MKCPQILREIYSYGQTRIQRILLTAQPKPKKQRILDSYLSKKVDDYFPDLHSDTLLRTIEASDMSDPKAFLLPQAQRDLFNADLAKYLWVKSANMGIDRHTVKQFLKIWNDGLSEDYLNLLYLQHISKKDMSINLFFDHIFEESILKTAVAQDAGFAKYLMDRLEHPVWMITLVHPVLLGQRIINRRTLKYILVAGLGFTVFMLSPLKEVLMSQLETYRAELLREKPLSFYRNVMKSCDPNDPIAVEAFAQKNPELVERFKYFKRQDAKRLACVFANQEGNWGGYYWGGHDFLRSDVTAGRLIMIDSSINIPMDYYESISNYLGQNASLNAKLLELDEKFVFDADLKKYLDLKKQYIQEARITEEEWAKAIRSPKGIEQLSSKLNASPLPDFQMALNNQTLDRGLRHEQVRNKIIEALERNKRAAAITLAVWTINEIWFPEYYNSTKTNDFQTIYDTLKKEIGIDAVQEELELESAEFLDKLLGFKKPPAPANR